MSSLEGIDLAQYGIYVFANNGAGSYDGGHVPRPGFLGRIYWCIVGGFLAILTINNIITKIVAWNRRRLAITGGRLPAYTHSRMAKSYFAVVSTMREISNYTIPRIKGRSLVSGYALGDVIVIIAYFLLLTVLFLVKLAVNSPANLEKFGYRGAWLSIGQLPLLIILAGRRSILGWFIGKDATTLNRYHRWVARGLLLTTSLHFLYFMRHWGTYHFIAYQFKTDKMTRTGTAAWAILVWIVFSSLAPVRQWRYEVFVIQHLISVVAFFVMVCIHAPSYAYPAIMVSIGFYLFDLLVRALFLAFHNRGYFKGKGLKAQVSLGSAGSLSESVIVTIPRPKGFKWHPGQHIYLSFPSLAPAQSHPFTVFSNPEDEELKFSIRARGGLTKKLFSPFVNALPVSTDSTSLAVIIDGPYGPVHEFDTYDTTIFLAAGTGMSFILPLVRNLITKNNLEPITTRRVHLVWVFKQFAEIDAYYSTLVNMLTSLGKQKVKFSMDIYITCEDGTAIDGIITKAKVMKKNKKRNKKRASFEIPTMSKCGQLDGICRCNQGSLSSNSSGGCCCSSLKVDSKLFPLNPTLSQDSEITRVNNSPVDKLTHLIQSFGKYIKLYTARPKSIKKTLLLPYLVKARGESAVIACGPKLFNEAVRKVTVEISDQRAVSRGTGAQGIRFLEEAYDF